LGYWFLILLQEIYESLRGTILSKLMCTLSKVFTVGNEEDSDEQLYDITRAYGLLLNASGITNNPVIGEELETQVNIRVLNIYTQ